MPPLAFTDVTVVDVVDGRLRPGQTVLIVGNRVQTVGNTRDVRPPKDALIVDARGKYLIPGLWDMHVHIREAVTTFYPRFIANGVTGVRDMGGVLAGLDSLAERRREIAAGTRIGPRLVSTGGYLFKAMPPEYGTAVTTPAEARRAVDSLKAAGADFIKVRVDLDRDIYFAIAAEARRIGIPYAGHRPEIISAKEASDSGQRSIEHMNELRPGPCWQLDSIGEKGCAEDAAHFIRQGTWFVPTLTTIEHTQDPKYGEFRKVVQVMHRVHMPMLAGTDVTSERDFQPGASLHEELVFLSKAGLTPLEALQTATLNPAKFFYGTDSLGTVAAGKLADLVLLDADPLADIHNTTKIRAVVANGRYFDRAALDTLVVQAQRDEE